MNILFVTLCPIEMNTSSMIRNSALINGLIQNNCQIDILTIPANQINLSYDINMCWDKNVHVIRLKSNNVYNYLIDKKNNFIGSIRRFFLPILRSIYHLCSLFDNTIFVAKSVNKDVLPHQYYDTIISSSDPKSSHKVVDILIKQGLRYGKWIQYWGDPLTKDITRKSIHPQIYVKHKEKQLFSCADKIVYVSLFTFEEQKRMFPEFANKMNFIPIPYSKEKIYVKSNRTKLMVGYFGNYSTSIRNIAILYETCKKMEDNIELLITGDSDLKLDTSKNISIIPRISQKKVEELESICDILVCVLNKTGTQIPGKIYHYAATNKPILVVLDGENQEQMRIYFEKFDRFVLCENSEESIAEAIFNIKNSNKEYAPSPHFSSEHIAKQFLDLII